MQSPRDDDKVVVRFNHTGGAPILKQNKFKFKSSAKFHTVVTQLKQLLGLKKEDSMVRPPLLSLSTATRADPPCSTPPRQFIYCVQAFAPPPDAIMGDLFSCFNTEGVLVLNYCLTPAWG